MDNDERMEEYISRPSRPGESSSTKLVELHKGVPARDVDWASGVFHGLLIIDVAGSIRRYILEDDTVCDEHEGSMSPVEIEQLCEDSGIPPTVTLRGLHEGELASCPRDGLLQCTNTYLGTVSPSCFLSACSTC